MEHSNSRILYLFSGDYLLTGGTFAFRTNRDLYAWHIAYDLDQHGKEVEKINE